MLENLKVGDPVMIFYRDLGGECVKKTHVTEVLKSGYRLEGSKELWKENGSYRGREKWTFTHADKFDEDLYQRILSAQNERSDRLRLEHYNFSKLSIEKVREVLAMLEEKKQECTA